MPFQRISFHLQIVPALIEGGDDQEFCSLVDQFQLKGRPITIAETARQGLHVRDVKVDPVKSSAGHEISDSRFKKRQERRVSWVGPASKYKVPDGQLVSQSVPRRVRITKMVQFLLFNQSDPKGCFISPRTESDFVNLRYVHITGRIMPRRIILVRLRLRLVV